MAFGEAMAAARKRQGLTQYELSQETFCSRESIAKYETGARTLPREMYATVTQNIDDPEFYFETWGETTGYVSIPYFDGDNIDQHPSSMLFLVKNETQEALNHLNEVSWSKPSRAYTEQDKEKLRKALLEALDAAASMVNLVASICKHHGFSMKDLFRTWQVSLKAKRYKR